MSAAGRDGALRLVFARHAGQTALVESYSRPPLQVMRAIRDAAGCLCVYLLSPTGGVVQGDRYSIQLQVSAEAHALFTTQSATKVYRMPTGYADQHVHIEVERRAILEFVPDATILFAEADLRQHIDVTLHPGALLILHEIIMPGRLARGEYLQFRRYANRLVVRDDKGLLLYDAADIEPAREDLRAKGKLDGYTCWGSTYLLGSLEMRRINIGTFCETHLDLLKYEGAVGSMSPLYRNGICARMLSDRLETIYAAFHRLRDRVRTEYLGLRDAPLRK